MTSSRRRAPADSEMRNRLIAAAADIIREQGYAALTSRTLAERLSLKRQILHYYFTSVDELLVLVVRDAHARAMTAFEKAARTDDPLHAIWQMMNDQRMSVLALELAALAARRPAVREEVRASAEQLRALQTRILVDHLAAKGLSPKIDPEFATMVIASLAQWLAQESLVGITAGHDKARTIVAAALGEFARTSESSLLPG
ncbi:MAG: TetR/AcrR family transcriptional regulator [Sphingomonadales bacterium]|nr:TetR/AcrR family transcriptional regulator [Sphingomonadales bacterium]